MTMQLIKTADGSHSILTPQESYHSTHGAVQESRHVFIDHGLCHARQQSNPAKIHVLEVGFGTGLNALLSWNANYPTHYVAIEPFPIPMALWQQLNYNAFIEIGSIEALHSCPWDSVVELSPRFTFQKQNTRIQTARLTHTFDVIYYDAFSPNTQSELWTTDIFATLFDQLNSNGILVTYCAKGIVRRRLMDIGFSVERCPGPPGKHHMLRATRKN